MSTEHLLLVLGAVLILCAALAGRPRVRAPGIRRVPRTARLAGAYAGALFVTAGLILLGSDPGPSGSVRAKITTELNFDETSQKTRVFLDGRYVGVVAADERTPRPSIAVTVAGTGRHEYRVESKRRVKGKAPQRARHTGQVVIDGVRPLEVLFSRDGDVFLGDQ
jgi:hypothetical protein